MHEETLYLETKKVLEKIWDEPLLKDFYLAGGTALALHLGHRKSVDLDFFSETYPAQEQLLQTFNKYNPSIARQAAGTLDLYVDTVKISLFEYKYPLLQEKVRYENINLATILDIACMKLVAVAQRGTKKDFVDLYFVLQKYFSLEELLSSFEKKYGDTKYQKLHLLKSLTYFEDAENDPEPDYLTKISWEKIKTFFISQVI